DSSPATADTASSCRRPTAPKPQPIKGWFCTRFPTLDSARSSFDVLHLFPEFFQLRLQGHVLTRNQAVVGLRADRVHFAVYLLRQKIQRAPDRFPGLHAVVELLELTWQRGQLFRNVQAFGEIKIPFEHPSALPFRLFNPA